MAVFNRFNCFTEDLAEGKHNLGADTLKIVLTNTAPVATNTVFANLTEITAGNGYTAGGMTITVASSSQTSGIYKLVLNDLTIEAAGGSIGPFRYFVLVNSTSSGVPLIGWVDYGSSITLANGESVTQDFSSTNGAIQLS